MPVPPSRRAGTQELPARQLNCDLLRLLEVDCQGSHGTSRMRRYVLMQAVETLHGSATGACGPRADDKPN